MKQSRNSLEHGSGSARRGWRGTTGLYALGVGCLTVVLAGCGNWIEVHDAGQLGLSVDAAGQPVVAVMLCATGHPLIGLAEGRKTGDPDSSPNVERGRWESRRAFSGVEKLAITAPDAGWKTTRSLTPLESDRLFLVDGGPAEDANGSLGGITFRTKDLVTLTPDVVRVNGKISSWRAFAAYSCR